MVAKAAYPVPLQAPTGAFPVVDEKGMLTPLGMSTLNAMWNALNGANVIIPCTVTQANPNLAILTPFVTSPQPYQRVSTQVNVYTVYSTWAFTAVATSTGAVTANVTPLSAIKVFKTNGSVQAGAGDIVSGLQYLLTYADGLDSGAGGFVLR